MDCETFATYSIEERGSRRHGPGRSCSPTRRLQIRPFFGHFAGMWITFDVGRSSSSSVGSSKVRVRVEGCPSPSYLYLQYDRHSLDLPKSAMQAALKDRCLNFVHCLEPPSMILNRKPSSLAFLCERKILLHLNELNTSILPSTAFSHLNPSLSCTQDIFVKLWSGLSDCPTVMERIRVKRGILVAELQWIIWTKLEMLSQFDPASLELYEYSNSAEKLSENSYLKPNQVAFHCIVSSAVGRDSIIVTLVGQGIEKIKVSPSMTLNQFQETVRRVFGLDSSSYLYFPTIFRNKHVTQSNKVAMVAPMDESTLSLINSTKRQLPLIDGIPCTVMKYDHISMYKLTVTQVNLLSSHLVHAYEVTGPTIPITFRSASSVGGEFVLVSEKMHAVSINLNWTVMTLLKYIEDISHFPCTNISYKQHVLSKTQSLDPYFRYQHWQAKNLSDTELDFIQDVPKISSACMY